MSIETMKQALEALQNSKPSNADGMLNAEAMNELWHAKQSTPKQKDVKQTSVLFGRRADRTARLAR